MNVEFLVTSTVVSPGCRCDSSGSDGQNAFKESSVTAGEVCRGPSAWTRGEGMRNWNKGVELVLQRAFITPSQFRSF